MKWTIRKILNGEFAYSITDQDGMQKGQIIRTSDSPAVWRIMFSGVVRDLDDRYATKDEAIAYVRGIEATVRLYGKEMAR